MGEQGETEVTFQVKGVVGPKLHNVQPDPKEMWNGRTRGPGAVHNRPRVARCGAGMKWGRASRLGMKSQLARLV